jgi:hypothetical protein
MASGGRWHGCSENSYAHVNTDYVHSTAASQQQSYRGHHYSTYVSTGDPTPQIYGHATEQAADAISIFHIMFAIPLAGWCAGNRQREPRNHKVSGRFQSLNAERS